MSQTKAHPEQEFGKKHSDTVDKATHEGDRHTLPEEHADPIPPAEDGGHAHSAAAHLEIGGKEHTKPAGNLRQGSHPEALREPPTVVQKAGKQHK